MENKETYHVVHCGKKSERRDYSKVSAGLDLPDLVEIQTASFEWFVTDGIREVFEDIYPIYNYAGNIKLKFLDYEFGEPKYSISECKYRETNYCAPLKAKMELEMVDSETGEVMTKWEDVFLGDFPLMTPTGTFIINGAERVIVSQIVRSPGAYFDIISEDRTGRDTYTCELIPSRGTWLEFMSDDKKAALGRISLHRVTFLTLCKPIIFESLYLHLLFFLVMSFHLLCIENLRIEFPLFYRQLLSL